MLVRYVAGDCDIFTYEDFALMVDATEVVLMTECETAEDAKEIQETIARIRNEAKL